MTSEMWISKGEISGNLNEILDQLASYLENIDDTRRKVRSAMTYPIFMLLFMSTMITAMFIWIIPKFSEVYAQLGSKLPKATRTLVAMSEWMSSNFGSIVFFSLIFIVSIWTISKTENSRAKPKTTERGVSQRLYNTAILRRKAHNFQSIFKHYPLVFLSSWI